MSNLITALGVLNSLLTLGTNAYIQAQKASSLINAAIQENRDLSDDELQLIWGWRAAAMERWNSVKAK